MRTFTDNAGRTWNVTIHVAAVKRVRDLAKVNLLDAADPDKKLIERLIADPVLLVDALYALCQEEAAAKNVSDIDFGKAMAGDAVEHATVAMLEELADFFPSRDRQRFRKVLAAMANLTERVGDVMDERVERIVAELDGLDAAGIDSLLTRSGGSAGSSPASPGSTPAP